MFLDRPRNLTNNNGFTSFHQTAHDIYPCRTRDYKNKLLEILRSCPLLCAITGTIQAILQNKKQGEGLYGARPMKPCVWLCNSVDVTSYNQCIL